MDYNKNKSMRRFYRAIFIFFLLNILAPRIASAKFPCNLDNYDKLPEIYLSGERHGNFFCAIDKEMHEESAEEGAFFLGLEGKKISGIDSSNYVFGLEEPAVHTLAAALFAFKISAGFLGELEQSKIGFRKVMTIENLSSNYHKLDTGLLDPTLDLIISTYLSSKNITYNQLIYLIEKMVPFPSLNLDIVTKVLASSYIREYNNYYINKLSEEYPTIKFEKVDFSKINDDAYIASFIVDLRNKIFAIQLAKKYCSSAVSRERPIVAIVGSGHLDGLKTILDEMSEGKISVKLRKARKGCFELFSSTNPTQTQRVIAEDFGHFCRSNEIMNHEVEKIADLAKSYFYFYKNDKMQERMNNTSWYGLNGIPDKNEVHIPLPLTPKSSSIWTIFDRILLPEQ